ncbi:MAG: threonine synthase [Rhizomicrobium sp.]|jgi:threonine synthase
MRYVSTRGLAGPQSFETVLLSGLASDGGLFLPESWPQIAPVVTTASFRYADVAYSVLRHFAGDSFSVGELRADIEAAYSVFDEPNVAPLTPLFDNIFLLELFHGPTLAFKDLALQLLGRLLARTLARNGSHITIVAATSGDTGSAAIAALGGLNGIELFVLHPKGRVSEVQRRQMTTAHHTNVHNIALEGTFDDAQTIVKALFADAGFAQDVHLSAVNSINFARIAAQCVYYFTAAARFSAPPVFVVPTGNFGDIFAGEAAMRMGLGIDRLVIATNANDILWRALSQGVYAVGAPQHTLSPSMDIQVASNFERALFEASGRDAGWIRAAMAQFGGERQLRIPHVVLGALQARYSAARCTDAETLSTMARVHRETGRLIDPHTAVAVAAALSLPMGESPVVVLSTAHAAKFPDAVRQATGSVPPLPQRLSDLYEGEERVTTLPAETGRVRAYIEQKLARG